MAFFTEFREETVPKYNIDTLLVLEFLKLNSATPATVKPLYEEYKEYLEVKYNVICENVNLYKIEKILSQKKVTVKSLPF